MNNIDTFLISEDALKKCSYIDFNVAGENIAPALKYAQDSGVMPVIGKKLFVKLKSLIDSGEINGAANIDYKILLDDYIYSFVAYLVQAEICLPLSFKLRNKGVVQTGDEHVQYSPMSDVQYLSSQFQHKADFYHNRLVCHLRNNKNLFPELSGCGDCCCFEGANLSKAVDSGLNLNKTPNHMTVRDKVNYRR